MPPVSSLTMLLGFCFVFFLLLRKLIWSFRKWTNVWIKHDDIWQFSEVGYVELSCGKKSIKKECVLLWDGKQMLDSNHLMSFRPDHHCWREAGRRIDCFFFLSRLEMNTRILHWKRFIWKVLLGEREPQRRHSLLFRSLSGCDVNICLVWPGRTNEH